MNKLKLWLTAAGVVAFGMVGVAGVQAGAWSPAISGSGGTVVAGDATHEGSLYAVGDAVRIEGNVEGDVYCAANTVVITGTVGGDVLCAAQSITVDGEVRQDIRVAGQTVSLAGEIGGSVSVFAQNVTTSRNLMVEGDINGAAQSADLNGEIDGGVVFAAQNLTVGAAVAGDLDVSVTMLRLSSDGVVAGDINYTAPREVTLSDGSVNGQVNYLGTGESSSKAGGADALSAYMALLMMFIATAFVVAAVVPRYVQRSSRILGDQPVNTVLLGFATVFALPIVAFFMIMTVVLVPLAVALLLVWGAVLILSGVFAAYYVGSVLLRGKPHVLLRMLGGVLVLGVLAIIPLLNVLVIFAATIVGSGALVATMLHGYRRPVYSVASTAAAKPASSRKKTK